jgi:hypothetical protein
MKKFYQLFSIAAIFVFNIHVSAQIDSVYYHDGTFESQWGSSTGNDQFRLFVRATPNTYPAQLIGIRAYFRNAAVGATYKWCVYSDLTGAANGGVTPMYISASAIANPAAGGVTDSAYMAYIDLTAANLSINSGDFYVGVTEANNNGFLGLAIDNVPATSMYDNRQWQYLFGNWNTLVSQASSGQFGVTAIFNSLSMGVNENSIQDISIYPNPTTNFTTVTLPENFIGESIVSIVNLQGEIVTEVKTNSSSTSIDVSNLSEGIYFLRVQNEDKIVAAKFVKQ